MRTALWIMVALVAAACGSKSKATKTTPTERPSAPVARQKPHVTPTPETPEQPAATPEDPEARLWAPIYFEFDSPSLSEDMKARLTNMAAYLKKNPKAKLLIAGHADERGTNEYNIALGDSRARAASDYINRLGITQARIKTISYGEERPAVNGSDDASLAQNRRDEFEVSR